MLDIVEDLERLGARLCTADMTGANTVLDARREIMRLQREELRLTLLLQEYRETMSQMALEACL